MKENYYIGIDLAWGEKNHSGFAVLHEVDSTLEIVEVKLLHSIEEILTVIDFYHQHRVYIGIDAPLIIPNQEGNRSVEKEFNKDFSPYKIAMLPVNRTIMQAYSQDIRSEVLYHALYQRGYRRKREHGKVIFEVYTHSTIALCFNNNAILPYKRKKGRNSVFIKEQLVQYQKYLLHVINSHPFLHTDIALLKGQKVKDVEDQLDAITCAYTLFYCKEHRCKVYQVEGVDTFITPIFP